MPQPGTLDNSPLSFAAVSDEDLNSLLTKLASGVTQEELDHGGLKSPDGTPTQDWFHAPGSGSRGGWNIRGLKQQSLLNQYNWHKLHNHQIEKIRAQRAAQSKAVNTYEAERAKTLEQVKHELKTRQLRARINGAFSDPSLSGLYDEMQQRDLNGRLNDVVDQYHGLYRSNAFDQAQRGTQGSSTDVEAQGNISQGQNAAAIQAAGASQQFRQGLANQNEAQRRSLVDTVTSDNPGDAAGYDAQIQGMVNQTRQLGQDQQQQAAMRQQQQSGYNSMSTAMGGFLSGLGQLYRTNLTNPANNQSGG